MEVISPPPYHMVGDGFRVHNFIPGAGLTMEQMNPFIMLDYAAPFHFTPSTVPRGVGVHPHRGFETVTIAIQGSVAHKDSKGNTGVIHEGDVQWMTAGSGILHEEFHSEEFSKSGGIFQMIQLWVNLPAKFKKTSPGYQSIPFDSMPKITVDKHDSELILIAGSYQNVTGPAHTFTPVHIYRLIASKKLETEILIPDTHVGMVLITKGAAIINQQKVDTHQLLQWNGQVGVLNLVSGEACECIIMHAEPIHESIAAYGPFVMNTREEIVEAYQDFQSGKF